MAAGGKRNDVVLGFDIGGTEMRAAAVGPSGDILREIEAPSPADDGDMMVEAFKGLARRMVDECYKEALGPRALGIVAAGYILQDEGVLVEAPNIAWRMVPLRKIAAEVTELPAFLDNDANGAAAGERFAGGARGMNNFVYLTLGTGVGGGVYVDGGLLHGNRGMAGELGHIIIDPEGPPCGCGRKGCLETLASGTALGRIGSRIAGEEGSTALLGMAGDDPEGITGRMVSRAAEGGDEVALRALREWAGNLGEGIIDLIHVFDPEAVILGGGVSESGHLFIDEVRRVVFERGCKALVEGIPIILSELDNEAGIMGAAGIAWEGLGGPPSH